MDAIIETIEQIKNGKFAEASFDAFGLQESQEKLKTLAQAKQISVPSDYSAILCSYGECDIVGPETNIIFFSIDAILSGELSPMGPLNGAFAFASDNGGSYYVYDTLNHMGKGNYAIFDIYPGNPSWKYSTYLAPNLTVLVERISKGENFG